MNFSVIWLLVLTSAHFKVPMMAYQHLASPLPSATLLWRSSFPGKTCLSSVSGGCPDGGAGLLQSSVLKVSLRVEESGLEHTVGASMAVLSLILYFIHRCLFFYNSRSKPSSRMEDSPSCALSPSLRGLCPGGGGGSNAGRRECRLPATLGL